MTTLRIFRIYLCNCRNKLSKGMQYRLDFFAGIATSIVIAVVTVAVQLIFYAGVNGFPGWSIDQVMLLQGILLVWNGSRQLLFGDVYITVDALVRTGTFDRLLLNPVSALPSLFTNGFNYNGAGTFAAGAAVTAAAVAKLHIVVTAGDIMLIALFFASGLVFYVGILTVYCALVVRLVSLGRMSEIFEKLMTFAQYPLQIYSKPLKWILVFAVPFTLWAYYPAESLLRRLDVTAFASPAVGVAFFAVSVLVFQYSLKKYASAGG